MMENWSGLFSLLQEDEESKDMARIIRRLILANSDFIKCDPFDNYKYTIFAALF